MVKLKRVKKFDVIISFFFARSISCVTVSTLTNTFFSSSHTQKRKTHTDAQ